jgi:hypothetical protein
MHKIIDNFLDKETFQNLKTIMESERFPWSKSGQVALANEKATDVTSSYYFAHTFFEFTPEMYYVSDYFRYVYPLIQVLKPKSVIRIKGNLYPSTATNVHHEKHSDYGFECLGAILYMNTNNGPTIMENGDAIESVENRFLIFESHRPHNSVTCTDQPVRMNININFF